MNMFSLRRNPALGIAVSGLLIAWLSAGLAHAQVITGTISGVVKDSSGAVVPGTTVTVKQAETGLTRTAVTGAGGAYTVTALPIGHYEVSAEAPGFKKEVRSGIELAVGQTAVIDLALEVGAVQQEVTVTGEAPIVNTTTSSTSGEVAPQQVKDLPLNGRSYDQLITLTTGVNNFTENDQRPSFSVSGKRGESNRFLINGVDLIGADPTGQEVLPTGASGSLLGVDAVQEFNVETDAYGAELGKRAGGQINIVTTSGTNQLHGDLFEFLRNTDANANGFFETPESATTDKRNQFGGSLGGPIVKDKVFIFGAYEGVRQTDSLGTTATVPDANAQNGLLPNGTPIAGVNPGMLPLIQTAWVNPATYPGGCTEVAVSAGSPGECTLVAAPLTHTREDFGLIRNDYNLSPKDSLAATFSYDNGNVEYGAILPIASDEAALATQLLSIQQTHIFSPELLNVATLGYSRAWASYTPAPYLLSTVTPAPIPAIDYWLTDSSLDNVPPQQIKISGITSGFSGSNKGLVDTARNDFTYADDMHYTKGVHDVSFGVWMQREQENTFGNESFAGAATFASITTLLQGVATDFAAAPNPTEQGFRSTLYAGYLQDSVKLRHNLSVRVGLRIEGDNGWNEHTGRSSNYTFDANGVMDTNPLLGVSPFTQNNAAFLPQPRVGLAWDPFGHGKTSIRSGFGIYDDVQDNLNFEIRNNQPYNTRINYENVPNFLSLIPVSAASLLPICTAPIVPQNSSTCTIPYLGGADPTMQVPTTLEWNLSIEQQLTKNLVLHIGYSGFESYHDEVTVDPNEFAPQVCSNPAGCLAGGVNIPGTSGEPTGMVPQGTAYIPLAINPATGTADGCRPNCDIADGQYYSYNGTSSYHALNVFLQQRFSNGIAFKANYTWSKALGDGSSAQSSEASNAPEDAEDFWNLAYNYGPVAYNIAQQFNANFDAALPFGKGHPFANDLNPVMDGVIGGWQFNGIFTAQSGFPFTPLLGFDNIGTGDSKFVEMPSVVPAVPLYDHTVQHWFNPGALSGPLPGAFGTEAIGYFTGPGLVNFDLSLFKKFPIRENKSLEFRVETFNLLNHPNLGTPNQTALQAKGTSVVASSTAGQISSLNGTNRELQFALKFLF